MTMTATTQSVLEAVKKLANALYFLDQEALKARDLWIQAKQKNDEKAMLEHRKTKVKIHNLKKKAIMDLLAQGHAKIKGYYSCNVTEPASHLLAVDVADKEFLVPISYKLSKNLPCLGEQGLVEVDESFESNLNIGTAIVLVKTYLNPNYEAEKAEYKKAEMARNKGKGFKKNFSNGAKKPFKKPAGAQHKAVA